eukprot:g3133.t1
MLATMDALTDRSRYTDKDGRACDKGSGAAGCEPTSLADLGFDDVGLDAGFEDCGTRKVGGKPAFHDVDGRPLVDRSKFPSGLKALVEYGHARNLTVSWYSNACACQSENSYTNETQPTIAQAIAGTVSATVEYGFDGLKLDSCSQFNNMTQWAEELNKTGHSCLLENCHQGGMVPGQVIPGQAKCSGTTAISDCPYHVFRTSDDIYNSWIHVVNNINSVTPYLTNGTRSGAGGDGGSATFLPPRSRPGGFAYPDMLETGNLGCKASTSACNHSASGDPPIEDRSQFGMWAIVSSPLILSVDLTQRSALDRVWPILSNKEAIRVNQHWSGSPGQLLKTDGATFPGRRRRDAAGADQRYYEFPGRLGQSRGWQNVPGMTGPAPWQVGPCVDEWTGGPCTRHYMTLGGGPRNMTSLSAAETWCDADASCQGFTYRTADAMAAASPATIAIYFRDETQIFFMDSEVAGLAGPVGKTEYTSRIKASRAPPLSPATSGVQIWVKDVSSSEGGDEPALALLLVNLGQKVLPASYRLDYGELPPNFRDAVGERPVQVRDVWGHVDGPVVDPTRAGGAVLGFGAVEPHDSVFYVLRPKEK